MPALRVIVAALGGVFSVVQANAEETAVPELEFLEYLGSWQEQDEAWREMIELEEVRRELLDDRRAEWETRDDTDQ